MNRNYILLAPWLMSGFLLLLPHSRLFFFLFVAAHLVVGLQAFAIFVYIKEGGEVYPAFLGAAKLTSIVIFCLIGGMVSGMNESTLWKLLVLALAVTIAMIVLITLFVSFLQVLFSVGSGIWILTVLPQRMEITLFGLCIMLTLLYGFFLIRHPIWKEEKQWQYLTYMRQPFLYSIVFYYGGLFVVLWKINISSLFFAYVATVPLWLLFFMLVPYISSAYREMRQSFSQTFTAVKGAKKKLQIKACYGVFGFLGTQMLFLVLLIIESPFMKPWFVGAYAHMFMTFIYSLLLLVHDERGACYAMLLFLVANVGATLFWPAPIFMSFGAIVASVYGIGRLFQTLAHIDFHLFVRR